MSVNRIWKGGLWRKGLQWATGALGLLPIGLAVFSLPVFAQIVPDNTLGPESSQVTPDVNIRGLPAERIDGGAVRGSALFHSFSEFNVNNGQRVYFSNPAGIADIFSRVTGSNVSNILGRLGVDGGANLFVLNPNGILFGPNSQLDIQGSFLATTGSSFKFSDGSEFSATQPQAAPLLTMSVTPGVQWGTQPLGKINNAGNLEVGYGQTLALHGGDVTSTGSLSAPGGTVMMLGDRIGLLDNARINVSSQTGGGTVLIGGGLQGKGAVPNATRTFVDAGVRIEADALTTGNGGNVIVWADEVTGFYGNISARGGTEAGNGGFVEVSGKQNLIFRGAVNTSASQGNLGTLLLDPENITIVNGNGAADDSQLNDSQILQGDGGALPFTISENALETLSGNTDVILQATNNITINNLTDNALIFNRGTGKITFTADADGNGVGSFLMQDVEDTLYTNGRNIEISGASLTLGNINTFSISQGGTSRQEVVVDVTEGGLIPPTGTSGTATFNFTVPNDYPQSTISDLNVRFSAEHTWDSDLDVSLQSPSGTLLNLFSDVGGGGDNFQDTLLDDEASTSINDGTAPFIGSFRPVENLAIFDNQNPIGNWTLTVTDDAGGDSGRLLKAGDAASWGRAQGTQLVFQLNITTTDIIAVDGNSGSLTLNATNGNISAGSLNSNNNFLRDGGAINLEAGGEITINSLDSSSSSSSGNGGAIALTAQNNIQINSLDASTGSGSGGNISITSLNGEIKTNNHVSTATGYPADNGGDITFQAKGNITIDGDMRSDGGAGVSGAINITSQSGDVTVNNTINSSNYGKKGGDISITALAGSIFLSDNARLTSGNTFNATGNGGNLIINTGSLYVTNSQINTNTFGQGNAGDVIINARETVSFYGDKTHLDTTTSGTEVNVGNGGNINITTGSLSVTNGAQLNASTQGSGQGGKLSITARNSVTLSDGGQLLAETSGTGRAGDVLITAEDQVALRGGQISTNIQAGANVSSGQASNITIQAGNLSVTEGGKISASVNTASVNAADLTKNLPAGQGDAGNIRIDVAGDTRLSGDSSRISNAIEAGAVGQAGSITLNTGTLTATGGASIDSSMAGTGKAGDINLNATGAISFSGVGTNGNPTGISSEVKQTGSGQGGNILLTGAFLTVDDGAKLSASTSGQGNGGGINITAPNSVTLSRNGQISAETSGSGRAGKVAINTPTLNVNGGAKVSTTTTSTVNTGTGGNLTVSANTLNLSGAKSGLFAETEGAANAGNLTLNPYSGGNDLQVNFAQGSQISASTSGSGTGGNIIVSAPNSSVTLRGDGSDKGGLSASASGEGNGGSIDINARRLDMGGATIRSEATNSNAGDIKLTLDDRLLLTHGSLISTTANTGNGGNITIKAPSAFVIAVPSENSDIIANAFSGNGGQINISAYRVFGLKPQNGQSFNTLRQNRTSDISASSQSGIQGTINIQSLSVDPSQGLTALPVDIVDPSRQIVNRCGAGNSTAANAQGEFVVTGRGGLPPSPDDMQTSGAIPPSWVTRDVGNSSRSAAPVELPATPSTPPLVEAQGMFINAQGEVVLTAQTSTTTPHQPGFAEEFCSPATQGNE